MRRLSGAGWWWLDDLVLLLETETKDTDGIVWGLSLEICLEHCHLVKCMSNRWMDVVAVQSWSCLYTRLSTASGCSPAIHGEKRPPSLFSSCPSLVCIHSSARMCHQEKSLPCLALFAQCTLLMNEYCFKAWTTALLLYLARARNSSNCGLWIYELPRHRE